MGTWKVSKEEVVIQPHYNADLLEIAIVGENQLVVQKGSYRTGDVIIFAAEKSLLPPPIAVNYQPHLRGEGKNRVGTVRLRGEYSCGVVISEEDAKAALLSLGKGEEALAALDAAAVGEDIADLLNIEQYVAPIPAELRGAAAPRPPTRFWRSHDCLHFATLSRHFEEGEEVLVTEKIHGSQGVFFRSREGEEYVSTKGLSKDDIVLLEEGGGAYWEAARNERLFEKLAESYPDQDAQIFAEVFPVPGSFKYGADKRTLRIFRVNLSNYELSYDDAPEWIKEMWVPITYRGPLNSATVRDLAKGRETVSGKEIHIKEGIVVTPMPPRRTQAGETLYAKIVNPKFKNDDNDIN